MLSGAPPFIGDTELSTAVARLTGVPGSLRDRRPDIPRSLEAVVLRCLARDPAARYQSAEELRASLLAVDSDNDEVTPPAGLTVAPNASRMGRPHLLVGSVVTFLFLLLAAVAMSGSGDGESPTKGLGKGSLAAPAGALAAPKALAAHSFDPFGDDKVENQGSASHVSDGDPNTAWKTSSYQDNFPKFKQGVGVYVDLGRNQKVRSVNVNATPGYTAEIFVTDRPSPTLAGWGKARSAGGTGTFTLGGVTGRYVLVWFTSLPQLEGGYRAEVSEIAVDAA
jgi:hypothetical protein